MAVKSIIASVENVRVSTRVFASADITADEMGNTWLNVNVWNAHGMMARETLALDVDAEETSMFSTIRHARRVYLDSANRPTATYTLDDIISRVDNRGGIYAANAGNNLANKLANETVRVMAEAMDSGNALVGQAIRDSAMRGTFAALV